MGRRRTKPVPGICDRCGFRYPLNQLRFEYVLDNNTGMRVCQECYDPSHPQLDTRNVETSDRQSVEHSRPDTAELEASRRLAGFGPVGGANASTEATVQVGAVKILVS